MFFRQYQLACLSLFSYLVGDESTGRAVVVDPQRDITGYLEDAAAHGLTIERVIETHFHADFLSGHLELARATGAAISYGSEATADFPIDPLTHGQQLALGDVLLEIRHTPGHTPESISVVVREHAGDAEPWGVLTGDALFVGDVGRPDLLTSIGWSAEDLARRLYSSLLDQLLTLPDGTRVFPAHGAGSACGKSMSAAVSSTIGEQRRLNYALRPMSEDEFVAAVTDGQPAAPRYFSFTADTNRRVHELLDDADPPAHLAVDDLAELIADGAVLVDGRSPESFASGHLRGAVNVGLDGRFAEYAGDVVRPGRPIVVVTDAGRETEAKVRLARIGFDRVVGAVHDVERLLAEHPALAERATRVAAADLARWRAEPGLQLVDVRSLAEQEAGIIPGAVRLPLSRLLDGHDRLDPAAPTVVYCSGGYRSSVAASLLRSLGLDRVADLRGGYDAWVAAGLPVAA
jgi:glyoxylase-like metal-dependent hydrolase (beta-lactamase superfamily II)/rhodanese-related sulfurtransferase